MKKNKNVFILIFVILLFLVFLTQYKFTKTAEVKTQNIEVLAETHQPSNTQITNEIVKTAEPNNQKSNQVTPSAVEKHEFTANELKEIQKLRNEAKLSLASNYVAMISFKAEWNRYTTDLRSAGFTPNKSELSYKQGFINQFQPADKANQNTNEDFHSTKNLTVDTYIGEYDSQSEQIFRYAPGVENINLDDYSSYCKQGCSASANQFEILLVLPLPNSNKVDVWTINERKVMQQVLDGTQ